MVGMWCKSCILLEIGNFKFALIILLDYRLIFISKNPETCHHSPKLVESVSESITCAEHVVNKLVILGP